jgi:hypothetical protein
MSWANVLRELQTTDDEVLEPQHIVSRLYSLTLEEKSMNRDAGTMVTGLFADRASAEGAYQSAASCGYGKDDVNRVMSDDTRKRQFDTDARQLTWQANGRRVAKTCTEAPPSRSNAETSNRRKNRE